MKSKQIRMITHGAILAALYVALTYLQNWLLPGTTSAAIQFRASEALCIFALFTPAAIPGLTVTIPLTVISFTFALIIAVIMALVQFANVKVLKQIARFYIWIFRGTPLLVQLFVVFSGLPRVGVLLDPFPAAVIVFSLNEGAYCAETIRAALESVPKGQLEAGQCVGLTYLQTIFRIVLPQAMRTAFPPLSNSLISMVKDGGSLR